ncbi:MAG: hypothetical protein GXY91_04335 [Clostridia bacterium]|nr:hypothetical protein [Clostridia bacterium]
MFKVIRNLLSQNCRCSENDCGCNNETFLLQLAIVAAFFSLLGDLIAFILAVISAQKTPESNNNCSVKKELDLLEKQIAEKTKTNQEIIKILEEKIKELKSTL